MFLPDVNILVNAFNRASPGHQVCVAQVQKLLAGPERFLLPDLVKLGFLRITTLRVLYRTTVSLDKSWEFLNHLESSPFCIAPLLPVEVHARFKRMSLELKAEGNLLNDLYLACIAIELGATLLSGDRDFNRIPGLRWQKVF